eukprot:TRINITY_DN31635_c0_g1_i1.p1 TRINITY_DN31635_c0_g1~~TRINITY_DN31635_c0_g1_i1.p1  ORF type:complete len:268 (+),score=21.86 TRINITY_DN31635_c0_g1_i1:69-806(+)
MCPLPWNADISKPDGLDLSKPCPYGQKLPGDVTLPFQPSSFDWVCVYYGYVPYAVLLLACIRIAMANARFGLSWKNGISFAVFCALVVAINEGILKHIVHQGRPERSCNSSCGMPSGHSTLSIGIYSLLVLEAYDCFQRTSPGRVPPGVTCLGLGIPILNTDEFSSSQCRFFIAIWSLCLVPVPISRVWLHDHSLAQSLTGSAFGAVLALLWYSGMNYFGFSDLGSADERQQLVSDIDKPGASEP